MQECMNEASRSMDAMHRMESSRRTETPGRIETSRCTEALRNYGINIDRFPVAMAYVPWQKFDKMYDDLEKAYCIGTVFPELNKPFTGRRCV